MSTASLRGQGRLMALILLLVPLLAAPHSPSQPATATPRAPAPAAEAPTVPIAESETPAVDETAQAVAQDELDRRCVEALYQLEVLGMQLRVFRFGPAGTRTYLDDRDRPAEIGRLNEVKRAACVADKAGLAAQQRRAADLVRTLSPGCREDREKLEYMRRDPHTPRRDLEAKVARVSQQCPDVPGLTTRDLWLADWVL